MIVLAVMTMLAFSGCSSTQARQSQQAARGMLVTQATIVNAGQAVDRMCGSGKLTQSQCDRAKDAYAKAGAAYDTAESLLEVAITSNTTATWASYNSANAALTTIYGNFVSLAQSFGVNVTNVTQESRND